MVGGEAGRRVKLNTGSWRGACKGGKLVTVHLLWFLLSKLNAHSHGFNHHHVDDFSIFNLSIDLSTQL